MAVQSETRVWDDLVTSTLETSVGEMQDNIGKAVPFLAFMRAADKVQKKDGGLRIKADLMYGLNSTVKFQGGYDLLDTTPQDGISAAFFDWKFATSTLSISYLERRQNSAKAQMFDLIKSKKTQLEISFAQEVARELMLGDGSTGKYGTKGIDGLPIAVKLVPTTGTYGGINPATTGNEFWRNQYATAISSWASAGLDGVRTMYRKCAQGQVAGKPNLILSDPVLYDYFEKEHLLYLKIDNKMSKNMADLGIENFTYKSSTVMSDEQLDSTGYMYLLNTDFLFLAVDSETDFKMGEAKTPSNQMATTAPMIFMGNIACNNRRKQGMLSITGA